MTGRVYPDYHATTPFALKVIAAMGWRCRYGRDGLECLPNARFDFL